MNEAKNNWTNIKIPTYKLNSDINSIHADKNIRCITTTSTSGFTDIETCATNTIRHSTKTLWQILDQILCLKSINHIS